ncbi:MAG: phosphoribosylformylglycinamidine cyclo-ligase [Chloroflexota bacterium]
MNVLTDISTNASRNSEYRAAGVDIDAAARAVDLMKDAVRSTYTPNVLADVGSFGGLFALTDLPPRPVLVASTDGVGTKVELAARLGQYRSLGHDIVNHCANDILVQNATPLFFLDYMASSKLEPENAAEIVSGIAEACRLIGCALLGGELAEMPGVYVEGALDLVGTVVGLVDQERILPRKESMAVGDVVVALPSSGPHTNGYSLTRKLVAGHDLDALITPSGPSWAEALLAPHRAYGPTLAAFSQAGVQLKGMAHITGGGLYDNIPRVLPNHLSAKLLIEHDDIPPLFHHLWQMSKMAQEEAFRVWNMGVGMVLIIAEESVHGVLSKARDSWVLGRLVQNEDAEPSVSIRVGRLMGRGRL